MSGLQKVIVVGNLVRDPEERTSQGGVVFTNFTVPVSQVWMQDGEKQEETTWFKCVAFGKTAEFIGKYFEKGKPIWLEGRVELDTWEMQDGTPRTDLKLVVDRAQFVPQTWGESSEHDGEDSPEEGRQGRQTARGQSRAESKPQGVVKGGAATGGFATGGDAPW